MSSSLWKKIKQNRPYLVWFFCGLLLLATSCVSYIFVGHWVIEQVYYGKSINIFNRIIQGQKIHPLSFYISLADKYFLSALIFLFLASVVVSTLFLLVDRMKIRVDYDFKKIIMSIFLFIFLLTSVGILKGESLRVRDDFLTLYKLSDDQKRAVLLSPNLLSGAAFYREIKKVSNKIPLNAKILLVPVSPGKLIENDPTRIKLDDYSAIYYFLYPREIYVYSRHYYKLKDVNKKWLEEKHIGWILIKKKTRLIVERVK